jgi:hypothetical protein
MEKIEYSWFKHHGYLFGLAVDAGNPPQTIIISTSQWARQVHFLDAAESVIYRRTLSSSDNKEGNVDNFTADKWSLVSNGLPKSTGTLISILAANPNIAGEFYVVNNRGIFFSIDSGNS